MKWLDKLFGKTFNKVFTPQIEIYKCCDKHTLTRQRIEDIEYGGGGIGFRRVTHPAGTLTLKQYRYWCPCGTELTDGPTGGAAVCAVCKKCRINYGSDLPGYWGH